jgi:hypothetical protein
MILAACRYVVDNNDKRVRPPWVADVPKEPLLNKAFFSENSAMRNSDGS